MEILADVNWDEITLLGLFAIGAVNVIDIFYPLIDRRVKWALSLVAALVAGFIPADLGVEIINRIKDSALVATAASGAYKVASKAGGH